MSQKHEISCWKCHEMTSLETRNEFDGCCWACGEEIDLDDYLIKAMDKRDEHYAALSSVTAERDRLLQELAKSETNTMALMVKHFASSMSSREQDRKLDECLSEGIAMLEAERDNYKRWYDDAMDASNIAGFAGMSAAQVIDYQDKEIMQLRAELEMLRDNNRKAAISDAAMAAKEA